MAISRCRTPRATSTSPSTASSTATKPVRDELRARGAKFKTDSDSEIALHLYLQHGMRATEQLRGEFAVLIADQRRDIMIAIRDRFGIKPLFYAVTPDGVFFASEIKALACAGRARRVGRRSCLAGPLHLPQSRAHHVRRHPLGAAGLLRHRARQ